MNKIYVIVPTVLILVFGGIYRSHIQEASRKKEIAALAAAQQQADIAAQKAEAERQAREDAERRAAERKIEEDRKEAEKQAKWAATGQQIVEETQRLREQATKLETELSGLESQLSQMRKERESAKQAVFEDRLAIEAARVAKRNAELEIQRFIEMTARRAGTTLGSLQIAP